MRKDSQAIFRQLVLVYPASKLFVYLIEVSCGIIFFAFPCISFPVFFLLTARSIFFPFVFPLF